MKIKRNVKKSKRGHVMFLDLGIIILLSLGFLLGALKVNPQDVVKQLPDINYNLVSGIIMEGIVNQAELNRFYLKVGDMKLNYQAVELGLNGNALFDELQDEEVILDILPESIDLNDFCQYVENLELKNDQLELGLNRSL